MSQFRKMIDPNEQLSIRSQCDLLGVNRSGLYYNTVGESEENLEFMRLMDQHFIDPHRWCFTNAGLSDGSRILCQ